MLDSHPYVLAYVQLAMAIVLALVAAGAASQVMEHPIRKNIRRRHATAYIEALRELSIAVSIVSLSAVLFAYTLCRTIVEYGQPFYHFHIVLALFLWTSAVALCFATVALFVSLREVFSLKGHMA